MTLNRKFNRLKEILNQMRRVIIAYSGGVDSTLLLKVASLSGLDEVMAVTGSSESLPPEELSFAIEMTSRLNIEHRIIETEELKDKNYSNNPPDRCYYCKKELFTRLREIAEKEDFPFILDGTNADDALDWRPGRRAAAEMGVRSPLLEAGLGKDEIRELSQALDLPTWDKPATPCLSSRFPYGYMITPEGLKRVSRAENFIKRFGIRELRVRDHSELARIEVTQEAFPILMDKAIREQIITHLKGLGYKYISLDLQGFRSGSSNELLEEARPGKGADE
jgi:uncharacterized protein